MLARVILAVATVGVISSLTACGRVDFAFEPKVSETRTYHVTNEFKTQCEGGAFNFAQGMHGGLDLTLQATAADANASTVKATFGKSDLKLDLDVGAAGMDLSAIVGQANATAGNAMDALDGKSFTAYVTPKKGVDRLEGLGEVEAAVRSKLEQGTPPGMPNMPNPAGAFGESTVRRWLEPIFPDFPAETVKVGQTWTESKAFTDEAPRIEERTYTFTELKGGIATLTYTLAIRPNADAPSSKFAMGSGKLELTGKGSGSMKVERRTGWIVQSEETLEASGPLVVESRFLPGGMAITVSLNSHMTVAAK